MRATLSTATVSRPRVVIDEPFSSVASWDELCRSEEHQRDDCCLHARLTMEISWGPGAEPALCAKLPLGWLISIGPFGRIDQTIYRVLSMARARVADALTPHLALQREGGEAMHWQLYSTFRTAILDGGFAPGTRLPSTRALADDLGVSRTTVLQAFERLVSEGYATARSGAGTRVATSLNTTAHRRSSIRMERSGPRAPDRPPRLSRSTIAMIDEFKYPRPEFQIPFALGFPAIDEFPVALWARLIGRLWRTRAREMLSFTDVRGYPPLREAIAQYVMTARGVRCTADQVVVVNGAQHGIDLMARMLLDPGDTAWVEDPG